MYTAGIVFFHQMLVTRVVLYCCKYCFVVAIELAQEEPNWIEVAQHTDNHIEEVAEANC